jgi:hypothetical protein
MIVCVAFGAILTGYIQAARFAEWSGYSLAAQALSVQQLEQTRAALWDPRQEVPVDETTNLNLRAWARTGNADDNTWTGNTNAILDMPFATGKYVMATNYVKLRTYVIPGTANPKVYLKQVTVDTVWAFRGAKQTNKIVTFIAPDQ